jgi:hypothetical protein
MDFILFIGICAFLTSLLFACILGATEALAINCSNCTPSPRTQILKSKTISPIESSYSIDMLFADQTVSLNSNESPVEIEVEST